MRTYVGLVSACLLITLLTAHPGNALAQTGQEDSSGESQSRVVRVASADLAVADMLDLVDTDRLIGHVDAFQHMVTRHVNSPQNMPGQGIGEAARYITKQFEDIRDQTGHLEVIQQEFWIRWDRDSLQRNIIAEIRGTDNQAGVIVIGAHYDSTPPDIHDGLAYAPGANDNATGVAAIIELARLLSARQPRMTIYLVAFSAEEIGSSGSRHFIQDYIKPQGIDVRAMINLDMIGGSIDENGSANIGSIRLFSAGPEDSPSRQLAHKIESICLNNASPMTVVTQDSADRPGRFGDQMSFSDAGYAAVRFIETAEHPNHQHSGIDTMEFIQPAYLRQATQTILAAVIVLSEEAAPGAA